MDFKLDEVEARVLGALLEKSLSTPEYYPLSLNALVNACNQKNNRDPVVSLDEKAVARAVLELKDKQLLYEVSGSRAIKYGENLSRVRSLVNREAAVVAELLLRGPQTLGELKGRTERMCKFESLAEAEEALSSLAEMGFVRELARQPGQKEPRFVHLLAGEPEIPPGAITARAEPALAEARTELERTRNLAAEVAALREELEELKKRFEEFKAQFD